MCGVYGIQSNVSNICVLDIIKGLQLLQHRGQDSCGISYFFNNNIFSKKGKGLVNDVFSNFDCNYYIQSCIGHTRYATSGNSKLNPKSIIIECQPILGNSSLGEFCLVHNGNIPQIKTHDTQYLVHFIEKSTKLSWEAVLVDLMETIPGSYSLLILTKHHIYAIRDRFGIRPLCVGAQNDKIYFSSESCAFNKNIEFIRNIKPGEIVRTHYQKRLETLYQSDKSQLSICAFEFVYLLRPNSICDNLNVTQIRKQFGKSLAKNEKYITRFSEYIVIGIPESGIISGRSYAKYLNLEYNQLITKNKNCNRTFILNNNIERKNANNKKFFFSDQLLGKKIIIVDDSIVRGNAMSSVVSKLWLHNVSEVHVRITSPPVINTCKYGIDIPNSDDLIARKFSLNQISDYFKINSLMYLNYDDFSKLLPKESYKECFGNNLPEGLKFKI